MKTIGYTNDSYPERRTIIDGNLHELKKVKSINLYFLGAAFKRIPYFGRGVDTVFSEKILSRDRVDGFHFSNSITDANVPWISTFETFIPRTTKMSFLDKAASEKEKSKDLKRVDKYMKLLASDNCKQIISLSECNLEMQSYFLTFFPKYKDVITKKMIHLAPPQKQICTRDKVLGKKTNKVRKFLFVGKDFVRKGGREIVDVFYQIEQETNYDFELQLVSLGKTFNYAFNTWQDTEEENRILFEKIKQSKKITLIEKVENNELLKMMQNSDVGLLPTWADTYGYSVLEFQAAGCPVITTNVRALPEINDKDMGWMIELETDQFNEIRIKSIEEKENHRNELQKQLKAHILDILEHPEKIKEKAVLSYDNVSTNYSVKDYMIELSKIYEEKF